MLREPVVVLILVEVVVLDEFDDLVVALAAALLDVAVARHQVDGLLRNVEVACHVVCAEALAQEVDAPEFAA